MKFTFSEFRAHLRDKYEMPLRFQNKLADENLSHLNIVTSTLFIFGIINLVISIILHKDNIETEVTHFIYYGFNCGLCFICDIWAFILRKFVKNASYKVKNIPLYVANVGLVTSFMFNFWPDGIIFNRLNGFILISCVQVVCIWYFCIYPNVFDLINLPFVIAIFIMEVDEIGLICAINIFIYFIILHILSVYKWTLTKNRLLQKEKIENINASLNREIELAATIQSNFLNPSITDISGWKIGYYCKAMAGVSGDMFDFYTRGKALDGFGIFDVSGHGISSGLITMLVKNILRQQFYDNLDLSLDEVMEQINNQIIQEKGQIENYLTGILTRINGENIDFVTAGHPLPLIYRKKTNQLDYYVETSTEGFGVIGLADFPAKYVVESIEFEKGDEMILYSDGIIDTENSSGEEFGRQRFLEAAKNYMSLRPQDQINFLVEEVRAFRGRMPQKDDITIIVIKKI